jgi:hypothetical protein
MRVVVSGFRREVDEICALQGNCAACGGNTLPTFRDNLSVPTSRVKNPKTSSRIKNLFMGPINRPETSVGHCYYTLRSFPEDRRSQSECEISKDELQKVGECVC